MRDRSNFVERSLAVGLGSLLVAGVLVSSGVSSGTDQEPVAEGVAAAAASEEDRKFGLTVAQRKVIFLELADAERRAEQEAESEVHDPPESMAEVDRAQRLAQKYKDAVAAKHGLTQEQAVAVSVEGVESEWRVE